ncbi:S1C family serine protease [Paludibaculum fermentans]|uniref:S1C family serine protease n=1 Tax=Paludibaculum fermentans TaxID=1473598 RepID=UPI003EC0DD6F
MFGARHGIHFILAACFLTAPVLAQRIYRDPEGIYTFTLPDGWRVTETSRGAVLQGPTAGMLIADGPERRAENVVASLQEALCKQWQDCKVVDRGNSLAGGMISPWRLISGTVPQKGTLYARLLCVSVGEGIVSLIGTSAQKDFPAMKPVFESVERSLTISQEAMIRKREHRERETDEILAEGSRPTAEVARPVARPPEGAAYRDTRGRFSLQLPAGWQAREVGDATAVSRGEASMNILIADGSQPPRQVVANLGRQMGEQWKGFQPVQSGDWQLGGAPAAFGVYSGVNPRGVQALARIVAAAAGGRNYVLIASVPRSDWDSLKTDLQRMEDSFEMGPAGGSTPASGATLGLHSRDLTPRDSAASGVAQGIIVGEVGPGSPAAAAGIRPGDIIISFNGRALSNTQHLVRLMSERRAGDIVELVLIRSGAPVKVSARLGDRREAR